MNPMGVIPGAPLRFFSNVVQQRRGRSNFTAKYLSLSFFPLYPSLCSSFFILPSIRWIERQKSVVNLPTWCWGVEIIHTVHPERHGRYHYRKGNPLGSYVVDGLRVFLNPLSLRRRASCLVDFCHCMVSDLSSNDIIIDSLILDRENCLSLFCRREVWFSSRCVLMWKIIPSIPR